MPAAAAKAKKPKRADLCRELLEIEKKFEPALTRIDTLKAELKALSETDGKFRETIPGLGEVSVSPPSPEHKVGDTTELVITAWDALTEARQAKLLEQGLVQRVDIIKGAYYGRVSTKLFAATTGAGK
ncbi:hypothetical protein ACVWXN_003442 [Bradyrhizobium sp. i1.4.4]